MDNNLCLTFKLVQWGEKWCGLAIIIYKSCVLRPLTLALLVFFSPSHDRNMRSGNPDGSDANQTKAVVVMESLLLLLLLLGDFYAWSLQVSLLFLWGDVSPLVYKIRYFFLTDCVLLCKLPLPPRGCLVASSYRAIN